MQLRTLSHGQLDNVTSRIRRDKALARLVEIATQDQPAEQEKAVKGAKAAALAADAVSAAGDEGEAPVEAAEAPKAKPKRAKKEVPAASDQPAEE